MEHINKSKTKAPAQLCVQETSKRFTAPLSSARAPLTLSFIQTEKDAFRNLFPFSFAIFLLTNILVIAIVYKNTIAYGYRCKTEKIWATGQKTLIPLPEIYRYDWHGLPNIDADHGDEF